MSGLLRPSSRKRLALLSPFAAVLGLGAVLSLASAASAQTTTTSSVPTASPGSTSTTQPDNTSSLNGAALGATNQALSISAARCQASLASIISRPAPGNSGQPKGSSFHVCVNGKVVAYGNNSIVYRAPPSSAVSAGEALYAANCSSCHEPGAYGGPNAPPLRGVGPAAVDFWVTTGRMPAATARQIEAERKPPRLDKQQADQIAAYIDSLAPAAPFIPTVNTNGADLADGASLFALNCAACHTITGAGDALAYGTNAPSLHAANATQVAEAIRTGPANMPVFAGNLSDSQVRDVVAYVVTTIQHPNNSGGAGLGGVGPVAEGFVALLFGVGVFMLICFWIGDRA